VIVGVDEDRDFQNFSSVSGMPLPDRVYGPNPSLPFPLRKTI
jgi:hypothetical protein